MAVIIEESIAPAFFSVACRQDPLSITHVPSILAAILIGGSAASERHPPRLAQAACTIVLVSKTSVQASAPWVRIPPSPLTIERFSDLITAPQPEPRIALNSTLSF
jgi:hypothetical protein